MSTPLRATLAFAATAAILTAQGPVVINEVLYDAIGGDDGQPFVEIYGPAGTDVSGWTIVGYEQNGTPNSQSFTFPPARSSPQTRPSSSPTSWARPA
jgi:hypothetical protein